MISHAQVLAARILIVDDEERNVLLLNRMFEGAGYTNVSSTRNPLEVCNLQRSQPFDLILLDITMPAMDGFQVLAALRAAAPDDIPSVLVITAEPGHKVRALEAGAKDFVSKPFELVEVLTRVHNLVEARLLRLEAEDRKDDNPALSGVVQRNIRKIIEVRLKATRDQSRQDLIANAMTCYSGSMAFFYVHIVWFAVWILANTGHMGLRAFDPYPYGLLTMIVSLEAIFLSTFVLISQNLLGRQAARLADLGLQTGLLTEHELTRALQMIHAIQHKLGIATDEDSERAVADLEMETKPEDVLAEIERLQRRDIG